MKKIFIISIVLFSLFCASFSFAADTKPSFAESLRTTTEFAKDLGFSSFDASVESVVRNILLLVNTLFFIFMIYGGIIWFTSAGSEDKIARAKSTVLYCIIGMAVSTSAYAITMFVISKVQ